MKTFIGMAICLLLVSQDANAENRLESWYTYWGVGWANFSYPTDVQRTVDDAKNLGLDNISVSLDLLGFYFPKGENTLLGVIVNGAGDRFEGGGEDLQINSYLVGISAIHFLNNKIGKGPFLRLDFGPTRMVLDTSFMGDFNSEWGVGTLVGGGVGFPVSSGTRLLLNVNYTLRRTEGETLKILGISLGGLF
jgi:hypothetical protein